MRPETPPTQLDHEEAQLLGRNHALPLEALRYPITPVGLHYLLIHFDIPLVDPDTWRLTVGGRVERQLNLGLEELKARPSRTLAVTQECAGNGRALLSPRPAGMPWLQEAVGTAEWTGTPLAPILEEAGVGPDAVEVVFAGLDRGFAVDFEHAYERSIPIDEALSSDVLVAYAINGQPLPPQHGFPVRVIVPGWYGMSNVKWLQSITVVDEPFRGLYQELGYRLRQVADEEGIPVTRMLPRALMIPPGLPDFFRRRVVAAGPCLLEGRAWSGWGSVDRVEVSVDGGRSWVGAVLDEPVSQFAWRGWRFAWEAEPGEHELRCRAADSAGNVQPDEPAWNLDGFCNNVTQRVAVVVSEAGPNLAGEEVGEGGGE